MKKHVSILILFLSLANFSLYSKSKDFGGILNSDYNMKNLQVVKQILDHRKSFVVFIKDNNKNIFLVKQAKGSKPHKQVMVVREMLAAYVGEKNNLSTNRVEIIPSDLYIPGKLLKGNAGTLHTLAPGVAGDKMLALWHKIDIQQPWYEKGRQNGITMRTIRDMARHQDLPKIVALDTFIGNGARRNNSLFYDEKTDRFSAIDLESSFNKNLIKLACILVQDMLNDKKLKLTKEEVNGLSIYAQTLRGFLKQHSIDELCDHLDLFFAQAKINMGSDKNHHDRIYALLASYKRRIVTAYNETPELIALLESLIEREKQK